VSLKFCYNIISRDKIIHYGIDQISWNLVVHRAGGTQRLPRLVGKAIAKDIIFTGRKINGIEALSMGMLISQLAHFFLKLVKRVSNTEI
jgi:enoyl-CoA hydratase/carnithine racemase